MVSWARAEYSWLIFIRVLYAQELLVERGGDDGAIGEVHVDGLPVGHHGDGVIVARGHGHEGVGGLLALQRELAASHRDAVHLVVGVVVDCVDHLCVLGSLPGDGEGRVVLCPGAEGAEGEGGHGNQFLGHFSLGLSECFLSIDRKSNAFRRKIRQMSGKIRKFAT